MKIYLAAPYSHIDKRVCEKRFTLVCRKAAELMDRGFVVFSPISHSHPISHFTHADANDSDFWIRQDLPFLKMCDEIWVYQLPGWEKSKGIKQEITRAEQLRKPVRYV